MFLGDFLTSLPPPPSSTSKAASDLLDLQPAFQQQALLLSTGLPTANTWGGESSRHTAGCLFYTPDSLSHTLFFIQIPLCKLGWASPQVIVDTTLSILKQLINSISLLVVDIQYLVYLTSLLKAIGELEFEIGC